MNEVRDLAAPAPAEPEPVPQGHNAVVVVGVDDYEHWPKLRNAANDALGIQKLFADKLGFVQPFPPLLNAEVTKDALEALIEDRLREALEPDDALLLFYAGHGHTRVDTIGEQEIETGYIVPVEARTDRFGDLVQIDPFLETIGRLPVRHILVILDACHSGFALGQAMTSFRSAIRYERDVAGRVSRKVITSARRDQQALDGGPVAGHSLFTGTLIDGLNWARADTDGNGLVTSSELGLYVQQQVAQSSESAQTPDFGAFRFDDRGEMVISLNNESFDALKARAFAALQSGRMADFGGFVQKAAALRPDSPETLYLQYRLHFYEGDLDEAAERIAELGRLNLSRGTIPLSENDVTRLNIQLPFWKKALALPHGELPVEVTVQVGHDLESATQATLQTIGDLEGYEIQREENLWFQIANPTQTAQYVSMITIDPDGGLQPESLWPDDEIAFLGIQPGQTCTSYPFRRGVRPGLHESRLFCSPKRASFLTSPPSPYSRAAMPAISDGDVAALRMQAVRCHVGEAVEPNE